MSRPGDTLLPEVPTSLTLSHLIDPKYRPKPLFPKTRNTKWNPFFLRSKLLSGPVPFSPLSLSSRPLPVSLEWRLRKVYGKQVSDVTRCRGVKPHDTRLGAVPEHPRSEVHYDIRG